MGREGLIRDALKTWAPAWPRRVTRMQQTATSREAAAEMLLDAERNPRNAPFVSVYSFPDGHTKEGNVPKVDTLFIDFDFEGGDYESGSGDVEAWRRDMSHLLVRSRMVAQEIADHNPECWRASLSGHKGIHLFLDFPAIDREIASYQRFLGGMREYATGLVAQLSEDTGISDLDKYVDVVSSDLGRLCRVPNTLHSGATESFGEERYCVPVTIEELADLTVDDYLELTSEPRGVTKTVRVGSENAHDVVERHVLTTTQSGHSGSGSASTVDWNRVEEYEEQADDDMTLEDVEWAVKNTKNGHMCVWRFYERDDKYRYGNQSHYMEIYCIREMLEMGAPIETIKEFLDSAPEYDEEESEMRIKQMISRGYNRFSLGAVLRKAPEFTGYGDCAACQAILSDDEELRNLHYA